MSTNVERLRHQAEVAENESKTQFGFWVYIMTDCVLFASLFATYAVLRHSTNGGPGSEELFKLPTVLLETMALLTSSFTCGMALLASRRRDKGQVLMWLLWTFILGGLFLFIEISEFHQLAVEGNSWHRSGFLSAFFTLVGTHGLHITIGLTWLVVLAVNTWRRGLTAFTVRRLALFSIFWHFLDLIWIFIFTIVYLTGNLGL
jgi:cytochrome o ubiquinol oxidase subunit 3